MALGMEVGLSPGNFVLDGDTAPSQKWAEPSNFRPTCIVAKRLHGFKMPLGTEVGLVLIDIVLDGDPDISRKMAHPPHPIFGPCLLWPNG